MSTDVTTLSEAAMLSVREAAVLLNVTEGYVGIMIRDGRIKAVKLDPGNPKSAWRIPRAALDRWLGPWVAPNGFVHEQPAADTPRPEGGLSREAIRRRAGLDSAEDDGHVVRSRTTRFEDMPSGRATDVPLSGEKVTPTHPEDTKPRETVTIHASAEGHLVGHPSRSYRRGVDDEQRPADVTSTFTKTRVTDPATFDGREPPPHDAETWGAGPASTFDDPDWSPAPAVPEEDE